MADKAHNMTDIKLEEMEKRLSAIYSRASKEIQQTADEYFSQFKTQDEKKRKLVETGKLSEADYKKWRKNKILYGSRFKAMQEQCAQQLLKVNETAVAYINGELPEVYALNYNALEEAVDGVGGYSFTLTDADTVRNLATTDGSLLPYKKLDPKKDVPWNMQKINAETLQGILQGESIDKIAKRIQNVQAMNRNSAIRTARTIVTGAECKGRQDSYHRAQDDGIILRKYWLATYDKRARDWHKEAGNTYTEDKAIEIDDFFVVDGEKMLHPGDSMHGASGHNLYNCRCSIASKVIGFKKAQVQKAMEQAELTATEKVRSVETRQQLESELSKITGAKIDLTGTDIDLMRENMVQLVSLGEEYGFRFNEIVSTGARKYLGEVTRKGRYGDIVTMQYPKTFYKSKSSLLSELRNNSERGEMPIIPGRKISVYTTTHEFAHTLSEELVSRLYDRDVDFWDEIEDVYARYRKSGETVLGKYATSNQNEFMAEAFAYAKLGNRPNEYADEVLSIIDKYFKRKKK